MFDSTYNLLRKSYSSVYQTYDMVICVATEPLHEM